MTTLTREPTDTGKALPETSTAARRSRLQSGWRSLAGYRWALAFFIINNLKRRYRRSVLGFFWGLVAPLTTMAIMATVFSVIFRADLEAYTVYVFSGLLPWSYMCDSALEGSQCLLTAESYLKKLLIPKAFFPLVSVGTGAVNFIFSLTSLLIIGLVAGIKWKATLFLLPAAIAITSVFNLGLVMVYAVATVYFRDVPHILRVTYPALFYLLPVIYPVGSIPAQYQALFLLNPFYHFIRLYRSLISDGCNPSIEEWAVAAAIAICALAAGALVLRLKERDLIFRL